MKPYFMVLFIGSIIALSDVVRSNGRARQSPRRARYILNTIRKTDLFRRFL